MADDALFTVGRNGDRLTVQREMPEGSHIDVFELEVDVGTEEVTFCIAEHRAFVDEAKHATLALSHEDTRALVAFLCKKLYGD